MINHLSVQEEQDRILSVFKSGSLMCKSALFTLLHAIITIILSVVNIVNGVMDFALGTITISKGVLCMVTMLLSLCRDIVEQQSQLMMIERRLK